MKLSDYVAQLLAENNIKQVFSVVGGGAMHLNDSLAHNDKLKVLYNHHEQASTMAAESYARLNNELAVACVTTGPGGTNTITGVVCAWQDNIPLLMISGQVRVETMVESTGLDLRQFGEQEHYIVKTVKDITKYAVTVKNKNEIKYHIEKAIYLAMHGRKGPCWVDIPLDVQGAQIEPETLVGFIPENKESDDIEQFEKAFESLKKAKRPLIIAGTAVRTSGAYDKFRRFIEKYKIPTVVATAVADIFPTSYEYYFGNFGIIGGRCGNFLVQNADCILVLGCRMVFKHIGFNYKLFSPRSEKIVVDVDENELNKGLMKIDLPVHADLNDFFDYLNNKDFYSSVDNVWLEYCKELKEKFPIYSDGNLNENAVNPYYFAKKLLQYSDKDMLTVVGNSCACDCVRQMGVNQEGQRLWGNINCGTMGYDLPGAIGAAVAKGGSVNCVTGDGSIMMNLQELQTIVYNNLPVKIFIHANNGYFAIVQTHTNFFKRLSGCTCDTGISMPDFSKIAYAFGFPYYRCENNAQLDDVLPKVMNEPGYCICEIVSDTSQPIVPKCKSKIMPDGNIVSPAIDDLFPFLDEDTYKKYSDFQTYKSMIKE